MFGRKKKVKLSTGDVTFLVPIDGNDVTWKADLIVLKLTIENAEQLHMPEGGPATTAFLEALANDLVEIGCPKCSPTMARQVWIAASEEYSRQEASFRLRLQKALG